jgi:hypothetical protein
MLAADRAQRYCPRINKRHKENTMSHGATTPASSNQNAVPMTPGKGLLVLLGVIVVIGSFIALGSALGVKQFWIAFLFLLYWTGVEHAAFDKLLACVAGAVVGLALAWSLSLFPAWFGEKYGMICFGLLILVTVYCQIMGWLPVVVNLATMLFLTVGTIHRFVGSRYRSGCRWPAARTGGGNLRSGVVRQDHDDAFGHRRNAEVGRHRRVHRRGTRT